MHSEAASKNSVSSDEVEPQVEESVFICQVKCSSLGDDQDGRRGKTLSRLRKRLANLNAIKVVNQNEKIAEAYTSVQYGLCRHVTIVLVTLW